MGSSSSDRITRPDDLSDLARDTEREFTAATSDIRRVVPLSSVPWLIATHEQLLACRSTVARGSCCPSSTAVAPSR